MSNLAEKMPTKKKETAAAVEAQIIEMFGDNEMRWYQIAARNAAIQAISDGLRRILIELPTGAGKTITIACMLDCPEIRKALKMRAKKRALRVLFVAHNHRLLTQAENTFAEGANVEIRTATPFSDFDEEHLDWADVVVIDEAHHEAMASIQYQLDLLTEMVIIGLTATPDRADGMLIKFEEIIAPISREQAVAEGWLAETSVWSFVDTSPTKKKVPVVKDILKEYHHLMGQTMIFMSTLREVQEVTDYINNDLGLNAVALITQKPDELDNILNEFSLGHHQFLVNCSKIGEGVDTKGCTSVLLGRTIGSYPLLNQYIGRAARPDSECQVFELVNPLSGTNLDTTVVVGTPKRHVLCSARRRNDNTTFVEREFDYTAKEANDNAFEGASLGGSFGATYGTNAGETFGD